MKDIPVYPLRYTQDGLVFMDPEDDCDAVVDSMLATGYSGEFCVGLDWDPLFITRLMTAGFLVMSGTMLFKDSRGRIGFQDIVLPKLHLVRSVLFFRDFHVKRSIKSRLSRYELRFNEDFETIVNKCQETHGESWLTPSLIETLFLIRKRENPLEAKNEPEQPRLRAMPVSFGLYRSGKLVAGEFGIVCGRVYTSYSGYREEDNAGTVQMVLMIRALEQAGFAFLDFGMPLDYKVDLGARNISPEDFTVLFRTAR
jgi:Leu/Phe-tRNA-protein transferase